MTKPNISDRYNGILTSFNLSRFIQEETNIKPDLEKSGEFTIVCSCPFDSTHEGSGFTFNKIDQILFSCPECIAKDFHDFIYLYPPDLIDKYCMEDKPKQPNKDKDGKTIPFSQNHIARKILAKYDFICDKNDNLFIYDYKYWIPISKKYLKTLAQKEDGQTDTKKSRREEIADYILGAVRVKQDIKWNNISATEIPVLNGVLNFMTGSIRAFSRGDYLENVFPVKYDPEATCEVWEEFLFDIWCGTESTPERLKNSALKVSALQEFMGYIPMIHAEYKKACILYGEANTGKSVIGKVLCDILSGANTCVIPVSQMGDSRKIAPIKGKYLNIVSDLPKDALLADGGFKQLVSTGDPVQVDEKYKAAELYIPFCKHLFLTNNLPRVVDHSKAVFERILILNFDRVFEEGSADRDPHIHEKILAEKEGILNWMIAGAKRLYENKGNFTAPPESKKILKEYEKEENPLHEILEEEATFGEFETCTIKHLKEFFNAAKNNHRQVSSRYVSSLARQLGYPVSQVKSEGKNSKVFIGFSLPKLQDATFWGSRR